MSGSILGCHSGLIFNCHFNEIGIWGTTKKSNNEAKGPVATHRYETDGNFTATLAITDASGIAGTYSFSITVTNPERKQIKCI